MAVGDLRGSRHKETLGLVIAVETFGDRGTDIHCIVPGILPWQVVTFGERAIGVSWEIVLNVLAVETLGDRASDMYRSWYTPWPSRPSGIAPVEYGGQSVGIHL